MSFIKVVFEALPHIATSPLAFMGYVLVVIAWVIISLRVNRNKELLKNLDKLPESSRLEALRVEMGAVKLKSGLTPEQWIRSRIHFYYFLGFTILCLVIVILFVVSATTKKSEGTARSDITLYTESGKKRTQEENHSYAHAPTLVQVANEYDGSGAKDVFWHSLQKGISPPEMLTLNYTYDRVKGKIVVSPYMPYLKLLKEGGPISDLHIDYTSFCWQFPKLSVKIVNNTQNTLLISEIEVKVKDSMIDREPVILVHGNKDPRVRFINEGWGRVNKPVVLFGVTDSFGCDYLNIDESPKPYKATLETFIDREDLNISPEYVSEKVIEKLESTICCYGTINYVTDEGESRVLKFKTETPPTPFLGLGGGLVIPQYFYDLILEAGVKGYSMRLPVAHKIMPGEAVLFVVRVGTNKSAHFDLTFLLRDAGGVSIPSEDVRLSVFVPRSAVRQKYPTQVAKRWKRVSKRQEKKEKDGQELLKLIDELGKSKK